MSKTAESVSEAQTNTRPGAGNFVKGVVKRVLPKSLVTEIQSYRRYKKNERPIYARLRFRDGVGWGNGKTKAPASARTFVFVCFGNIMRSPMCEALMKREIAGGQTDQIKVSSAGMHATPGKAAHPWALAAARELGIALDNHRAQLVTPEMVNQADAIFAMDYQNQVELLACYPKAKGKIFMLGAYAGDSYRAVEIPDPFYADPEQTLVCYRVLGECIRNLVAEVLRDLRSGPNRARGEG